MDIDEPLFRPVKRRKFLRKRQDQRLQDPKPCVPQTGPPSLEPTCKIQLADDASSGPNEHHGQDTITVDILRRRKAHKVRRGGIEFSTGSRQMGDGGRESPSSGALTLENVEEARLRAISDRFIPYTGQQVDVDKHMYISLLYS
jgi:hypothetical protein